MPFSSREQLNVPHNVSCPSVVLPKLLEYGEKTAFYEDTTGRALTFNDFVINVKRLGAALQKQDLNKGHVITICAPNCIEHPLIYYAASTIGALFHSTNPAFPEKILIHQINTVETSILVTNTQSLPKMKAILEQCPSVKNIFITGTDSTTEHQPLLSLLTNEECEDVSVNDPHYDSRHVPHHVVFTSGTTGLPKALRHSHYACLYTILQLDHEKFRASQPGDVSVVIIPFFHVIGQMILMAHHLYTGTKQILVPTGLDFDVYMRATEKYKADVIWGNTPLVNRLATTSSNAAYDLSSVRALTFGGSAVREGILNRLLKTYPRIKMVNQMYGLSEIGIVTLNINSNKPLSCGLLIPGAEAKFVDLVTNKEVGPNSMGELYIKAETAMLGYFSKDGKSRQITDEEGWTCTGDAGYYDEEGYIYIVDRVTQLIKHKSEYVYPSVIDNILLNHPGVDDVATIAAKRPVVGDVPYCFIVSSDTSDTFEAGARQTLSKSLDPSLAAYVEIGFIEEIPRGPGGKYHIEQLRQWTENKNKHSH